MNVSSQQVVKQQALVEKKIGVIVQTAFKEILESGNFDPSLINLLQTREYSKRTFRMNFPILVKISSEEEVETKKLDHLGRSRYYAYPVHINGEIFILTSQWYERNKPYLINWIRKNSS